MASKKTKTTESTEGVPAVPAAVSAPAGADAPATGTRLRWTSLQAAPGVAHRTKKPKTKKAAQAKTDSNTKDDAASKLSALDAAAKVL